MRRTADALAAFRCRLGPLQILVAVGLLAGCAYAPPASEPQGKWALPPAEGGALAALATRVERDLEPAASAYRLLDRSDDALAARLALVDHAVATLDVQYFIWQNDATSRLVVRRLIHAADRGVRVRVLLDDLTLSGWDSELMALDRHPFMEIRVFNPWHLRTRAGRLFEFPFRMDALNHRMHGKAVVVDNLFGIIGGRNLGNRYFGLDESFVQNDLDVLLAGPLVLELSDYFDLYWNSLQSYPVSQVVSRRSQSLSLPEAIARVEGAIEEFSPRLTGFPNEPKRWDGFLESLTAKFTQGAGVIYYDTPYIDEQLPVQLYEQFTRLAARTREELLISSPYFIPDHDFVNLLADLVAQGVRVVVVTNSLATNNHVVAHTGYRKWRRDVLEAGVELYEMRIDAETAGHYSTEPVVGERVGLHTKAVVVDGRYSFVGSPNVDPRSMILNTEVGIVVDDEVLAGRLRALVLRDTEPHNAWRVLLRQGDVYWSSGSERLHRQPARGFGQRVVEFLINLLPLKNQG